MQSWRHSEMSHFPLELPFLKHQCFVPGEVSSMLQRPHLRRTSARHPCSFLSVSPCLAGLIKIQNSWSRETENQLFPATSLSLAFCRSTRLSPQIADLHGKNRNTGHHMCMQICQPNSVLKIVIYYLACILAQKTLYTYFMLI